MDEFDRFGSEEQSEQHLKSEPVSRTDFHCSPVSTANNELFCSLLKMTLPLTTDLCHKSHIVLHP